ncbi:MAG: hypothetical protein EB006_07585, partial [Betaproteobacteria bacterium]|nr:hypothetical protein [Betaproteobacteria bacterium]
MLTSFLDEVVRRSDDKANLGLAKARRGLAEARREADGTRTALTATDLGACCVQAGVVPRGSTIASGEVFGPVLAAQSFKHEKTAS